MADTTRRRFLQTTAVTAAAATTGCIDDVNSILNGNNDNPGNTPSNNSGQNTDSTPAEPLALEIPEQKISIEWSPELAEYDEVPGRHHIPVEVAGAENIEDVQLGLEKIVEAEADYEQDELLTSQIPLEQLEADIPGSEFFTGAQTLQLQQNGETVDSAPVVKNIPEGYRVDVRNTDGEVLSEWSTPYSFDTLVHRPEEMSQKRVEHNRDTYLLDNFLEEVRNDAGFEPGKYHVVRYPNFEDDGTRNYEKGHFDLQTWKETETFEEMMQWIDPAVRVKTVQTDQVTGGISTNAEYMAVTAELAINQIHPTLQTHSWGVQNGGAHGTMMFYDVENEEWWHSDTSAIKPENYIRKPENAQLHRDDVWSPFTAKDARQPGFHPGPVKEQLRTGEAFRGGTEQLENRGLSYPGKSRTAQNALFGLTYTAESSSPAFITDEWMDEAYEHIRNDGDLETIREPIQQAIEQQMETSERQYEEIIGIYGTIEQPKMVSGKPESIQPLRQVAITNPDILVDEDHVHQYLEDLGSTDYRLEEA